MNDLSGIKMQKEEGNRDSFKINNLPQVVFLSILSYLDLKDLGRASCVSKHWYNSTLDPCLWRKLKLQKRHKVDDEVLVRITNHGSAVSVLDVSECRSITEEGLLKALLQCKCLVDLSVVRCVAVTDKILSVIGQSCRNIRSLDISLCRVTDTGVKEVRRGVWKYLIQCLSTKTGRYRLHYTACVCENKPTSHKLCLLCRWSCLSQCKNRQRCKPLLQL